MKSIDMKQTIDLDRVLEVLVESTRVPIELTSLVNDDWELNPALLDYLKMRENVVQQKEISSLIQFVFESHATIAFNTLLLRSILNKETTL